MKTILAPIDLSQVSAAVVEQAAALARAMQGRVILLTVIQPPVVAGEYPPIVENIAEISAAGEKNASRRLDQIEQELQGDSVEADSVVTVGTPIQRIVEHAEQVQADYIVMGSHGHTALYDLLVGSTTHGVLMRAKCPVVIVPAPKSAKGNVSSHAHAAVA